MDRAGRNFLALTTVALVFGAYGLCALIAYGVLPLAEGRSQNSGLASLAAAGLATLLVLSAFRAARTLRREMTAARALSRRIEADAIPIPSMLVLAAREVGLAGRVQVVDSARSCSFVYGALAPRVVLSGGLLSRLSGVELRAALEHERYHVLSLDPLRDALARAAVDGLFFFPALKSIHRRYEAARELAADRRAVTLVGSRPLAAALLKAMEGAGEAPPATVALAAPGVMEARLTQLETGREPGLAAVDGRSLAATALGALAFLILLAGIPLAAGGSRELARELGPASLLEGAILCLLPLTAVAALIYRRLWIRSTPQ
jgi:Zn-dependent protease with chaperone function